MGFDTSLLQKKIMKDAGLSQQPQSWFEQFVGGVATAVDEAVTGGVGSDIVGNLTGKVPTDYSLGQSKYDFTSRIFPLDLAGNSSYNGHYMVININIQDTTRMTSVNRRSTGISDNLLNGGSNPLSTPLSDISKTDALRYNIDKEFQNAKGEALGIDKNLLANRPRYTRRVAESIALYMPNSEMTFTDQHDYQNISLTKIAAAVGTGALNLAGSTIGAIAGGRLGGAQGAVDGASALGGIGNGIGTAIGAGAQVLGAPINPKVEVLYANTFQREFSFDFLFAPASEGESIALEQIIRTLRFHAAPELRPSGAIESFFWVPPSEFDITFYNRGEENKKIPRINTCVLKQVDVSYAPTGTYATFSNGYPVQTRMVLRFTETEVISKLRVLQGF